jgi:sugar diacid utilization regulator
MESLNVNTTARDLTLNLHDSCNCCCWGKPKLSPKTRVYIKHTGEVVVFDNKLAKDSREAMLRCISNLNHIIENMKEEAQDNQKVALDTLKERVNSISDSYVFPITLEVVEEVMHIRRGQK